MNRLNSRLKITEETVNLKKRSVLLNLKNRGKKILEKKKSLRDPQNNIKRFNIGIIGIPEEEKREDKIKNIWTNIVDLDRDLDYTDRYFRQYSTNIHLKFNKYTQNSTDIHLGSLLCVKFMPKEENCKEIVGPSK